MNKSKLRILKDCGTKIVNNSCAVDDFCGKTKTIIPFNLRNKGSKYCLGELNDLCDVSATKGDNYMLYYRTTDKLWRSKYPLTLDLTAGNGVVINDLQGTLPYHPIAGSNNEVEISLSENVLSNVDIMSPSDGDILVYNETSDVWVNQSVETLEIINGGGLTFVGGVYDPLNPGLTSITLSTTLNTAYQNGPDGNTILMNASDGPIILQDDGTTIGSLLIITDGDSPESRYLDINSTYLSGLGSMLPDTNSYTISIGQGANPNSSTNAIVLGTGASVSSNDGIAIGTGAAAACIAIGPNSTAIGSDSIAMGNSTSASGTQSIVIGRSAMALGANSTAIGTSSSASGINTVAIGDFAVAPKNNSIAVGNNAAANGLTSMAIGHLATCASDSINGIAIGRTAICNGGGSIVIGQCSSNAESNIIMGSHASSMNVEYSISIGIQNSMTTSSGLHSHDITIGTNAVINDSKYGTAIGESSQVLNSFESTAIGFRPIIRNSNNSYFLGKGEIRNSVWSVAMGDTINIGNSSDASIYGNIGIGTYVNLGNGLSKGADYMIGIGADLSVASTNRSLGAIAIGGLADCNNPYAIGIGYNVVSSGSDAIAIGRLANSSGDHAIVIGNSNNVSGDNSLSILPTTSSTTVSATNAALIGTIDAPLTLSSNTLNDNTFTKVFASGERWVSNISGSNLDFTRANKLTWGANETLTTSGNVTNSAFASLLPLPINYAVIMRIMLIGTATDGSMDTWSYTYHAQAINTGVVTTNVMTNITAIEVAGKSLNIANPLGFAGSGNNVQFAITTTNLSDSPPDIVQWILVVDSVYNNIV